MTIKVHEKLLLTGAAGGLGKALRQRLKANCTTLRLSDLQDFGAAEAGEEVVLANLADAAAVDAMVKGVDAIIHLGGISVEGPFTPILQGNIIGAYNLYEAARKHGVKRVVFASSNHVVGFYRQDQTITADDPPRPDGLYGLSKAFGEDLSRLYFDRYGIETACVRIGSSFEEPRDRRMLATWLSFDDLHRLITACLTTPVLGHSIIFGMSDNAVTWWDNSRSRHVGYVPQDSSDVFRDAIYARTSSPDLNDPSAIYQGGGFVKAGPFPDVSPDKVA
ncbi:MAG: NAD(P)-dependent oxidoreductase [Polaromonas sp.]|uniref:NAD-dependent epimerase/dehydratase family protein n=1 Tax=Polaromonas sp. TaxID=1869339 RepID=UPI0025CD1E5B|nr:NAD(P)-dependent oxidoreductase [Polaromonas sp.]MBI2728827.1 NAD(P)-dependent oxidoreductase [Polaromonas sp.]